MNKVIFVIGPTASGKTSLAISLAKKINGEIISCDSMQVYKNMAILSQAPSKKQLKETPHYLISELNPEEEYSVAQFRKHAEKLIKEIIKRGKAPIITGGTGLYVKALIDGLFESPAKDKALRDKLESEAEKHGTQYIHDKLKELDSQSAKAIHSNDRKRIIRALEVYYSTGIPLSEHKKNTKGIKDFYEIIELGIVIPRDELYKRINKRVEKMFKNGLINEIKKLLKKSLSLTASFAIGIKEVSSYLRDELTIEEAKELVKMNTRRYAKRQLTWFKADKRIKWFSDGKSLIDYCRSGF